MSTSSLRVAGTDPGTSSLDVLILEDENPVEQVRFTSSQIQGNPVLPVKWLEARAPFSCIVGPSGYGLPLVPAQEAGESDLQLLSLTRPEERGSSQGVPGFSTMVQAFCASELPTVFIPGVIHLPTVPDYRKRNRIDLGTADKLCVVALALSMTEKKDFCLIELGSAFTACIVVQQGQVVDGLGGTCGPLGWKSGGAWDGEMAYWLSPLKKQDLFEVGAENYPPEDQIPALTESALRVVAGMKAIHRFDTIYLSGRGLERSGLMSPLAETLRKLGEVKALPILPGVWVKQAAQGAALLANGLAGGRWKGLVEQLGLNEATGTVVDWNLLKE